MQYFLIFLLFKISQASIKVENNTLSKSNISFARSSSQAGTKILSLSIDYSSVNIVFVYGPTSSDHDSYLLEDSVEIIQNIHFDRNRQTLLYIHGYSENLNVESIRVITAAYLKRNDHNILIVDWSTLADGNYVLEAVPGMFALSPILTNAVIRMFQNGLLVAKLHIVGHSLGAQLAGLLALKIHTTSNGYYKVKRLTALDPAFPFFVFPKIFPINQFDADFVDIIHTDAGIFGEPIMTGSVDFWPNGGRSLQPGCPLASYQFFTNDDLEYCSHHRSWRYWAESVASSNPTFHAVKSKSYFQFKLGNLETSPVQAYMGIDASPLLSGNFYLQTSSVSPFSRGELGMKYQYAYKFSNGLKLYGLMNDLLVWRPW